MSFQTILCFDCFYYIVENEQFDIYLRSKWFYIFEINFVVGASLLKNKICLKILVQYKLLNIFIIEKFNQFENVNDICLVNMNNIVKEISQLMYLPILLLKLNNLCLLVLTSAYLPHSCIQPHFLLFIFIYLLIDLY